MPERPASLDPLYAAGPVAQLVTRQIYSPLIAKLTGPFDDTRRVDGLALSARSSRADTLWRLRLRSGVRFGDGAPFNSLAVLANAERWQSSLVATELLGQFQADAPKPDLVRFWLSQPDPGFAARLASPRLGIVSPRALAEAAGGEIEPSAAADAGTGAFELRERSADSLLLAVNDDWWGSDRDLGPGLDQIALRIVPEARERLAALEEGEVQVAGGLAPQALRRVRRNPLLGVVPGAREGEGLAIERSIRGIPPGVVGPALSGVWRTGIGTG